MGPEFAASLRSGWAPLPPAASRTRPLPLSCPAWVRACVARMAVALVVAPPGCTLHPHSPAPLLALCFCSDTEAPKALSFAAVSSVSKRHLCRAGPSQVHSRVRGR